MTRVYCAGEMVARRHGECEKALSPVGCTMAHYALRTVHLANFLRTLRSGWKYSVRTVRATTGPGKEGQFEYDNQRMAALAQVLARDPAAWISRAYGRPVVLQPTMSGKIGASTVVLWLPSR